jgi:hypothetical protein
MVPTFIHVGFMNSGTTSLQRNFFSRRSDFFYAGEPYHERGGIFSNIRSGEDYLFDRALISELCDKQIYKVRGERTIVISDETFCDTPQTYFAPFMVSRDHVAMRLKRYFPDARIIFTIREQRQYVTSMYLNFKRNSAFLDRCTVPKFSRWFRGMLTQVRCHYLQNLDYSETIGIYAQIFGRSNLCILPLEMIANDGERVYLGKLCDFMGVQLYEVDIDNFCTVQNRRMSTRKNFVSELMADDRFSGLLTDLAERFGRDEVDAFIDDGPRAELVLSTDEEHEIERRVSVGNRLIAQEFGLDLERYGYLLGESSVAEPVRAAIVRGRLGFERSEEGELTELEHEFEINSLRLQIADLIVQAETRQAMLTQAESRIAELGDQLAILQRRLAEIETEVRCERQQRVAEVEHERQQRIVEVEHERQQRIVEVEQERQQRIALQKHFAVTDADRLAEVARLSAELAAIRQSRSWRITAPLRQASDMTSRLRRRVRPPS